MGVSKVVYDGETLVDLTGDSVTLETLAYGVTAHNAAGEQIVGTKRSTNQVVTLAVSDWSSQLDGMYYQTVVVDGMKEDTAVVILGEAFNGDDGDDAIAEAWQNLALYSVEQTDGALVFCVTEVPDTDIPLNVGIPS